MSLSQLHKKQLEEYNKEIPNLSERNYGCDGTSNECCGACGGIYLSEYKVELFLTKSTLSTLQAFWQMLEEGKKVIIICSDTSIDDGIACRSCLEGYSSCDNAQTEFVYNQSITDAQKKIEEEIIKIKEMKI